MTWLLIAGEIFEKFYVHNEGDLWEVIYDLR